MPKRKVVALDFETQAIQPRPLYPPKPVGLALRLPGRKSKYYAWGHPTGNNCSLADAERALKEVLVSGAEIVCHNLRFDADVAETHFGVVWPWDRSHDTMILGFLYDPNSRELGLKPLAEKLLGLAPTERDEVREWLVANKIISKTNKKTWGAHIADAPGDLVGKYAIGDVDRTHQLFEVLYEEIRQADMLRAYARELALLPILLENERQGLRVDLKSLRADIKTYEDAFSQIENWVRAELRSPDLNLDETESLADALDRAGKVTAWELTETGARSTSKSALENSLNDPRLYAALVYRGTLATCLRTFMRSWVELAQYDGRIRTTWNTTRQAEGGGTRTGRLSSSKPLNLQNVPTDLQSRFADELAHMPIVLPELPTLRNYIVADIGCELVDFDFSSQEPRTFAHFEDGWLLEQYQKDPRMDVYMALVAQTEAETGIPMTRRHAKTVFLGLLYGMGVGKLALQLGAPVEEAAKIKKALMRAVPSIKEITTSVMKRLEMGGFITTWGGRRYYAEQAVFVDGRRRDFSYKGINTLIQGSAADETKEALIRYHGLKRDGRLLAQVHDEILICAPKKSWKQEAKILKECMEGLELDVPMIAEGEHGFRWGTLEEIVW